MASPDKLGRRIAALMAGRGAKPIRAYHGSPHSFDRFDASKIGTGEGAQAYGHGLYFAGAEDTADFYRRELSGGDDQSPQSWVRDYWEAQAAPGAVGSPESAHEWLVSFLRSNSAPGSGFTRMNRHYYRKALDYLLEQDPHAIPSPLPLRPGHMYEVELGVPEEALLDLDAPVFQQSPEIIAALGHYAEAPRHFTFGQDGWRGMNAYMAAAPSGFGDAMREASRRLMKAGIPGLRYFDGNSRSAGTGTRNYVMFPGTEDRIRILRKYGLLAPMALPALQEGE